MDLEIVAINRERKHIFENLYHLKDLIVQILNLFTFLKTVPPTQVAVIWCGLHLSRLLANSLQGMGPFPAYKRQGRNALLGITFIFDDF